jgi:flagellar hook-length control protein FliK
MNPLLNLGAAAPGASGVATGGILSDEGGAPNQAFAQLLNDTGAQAGGEGLPQFAGGQLFQAASSGVLAAQELVVEDIGGPADAHGLEQPVITVDDAGRLIERIDGMLNRTRDEVNTKVISSVKEQLQRIAAGGEPKTAEQIVQTALVGRETRLSPASLVALITPRKWGASKMHEDEEVPAHVSAMWQNVHAAMFRPNRGEDSSAKESKVEEAQEAKQARELNSDMQTVVEPLSASLTVVVPVNFDKQVSPLQVRPDLDEAVPSLSIGLEDHPKPLPEIELPKLHTGTATRGETDKLEALSKAGSDATASGRVDGALAGDGNSGGVEAASASFESLVGAQPHIYGSSQTHQVSRAITMVPTPGYINQAPVSDQVHVAIHQAAKDGLDHITIQLDPVDLGRVEVNMQTSRDGQTQINFIIDKPETFDSLSRDARFLERTLQEAGIKADTGSMQFNLRQQPQQNLQADVNGQGHPSHQPQPEQAEEQHASLSAIGPPVANASNYFLNVREGVDISA